MAIAGGDSGYALAVEDGYSAKKRPKTLEGGPQSQGRILSSEFRSDDREISLGTSEGGLFHSSINPKKLVLTNKQADTGVCINAYTSPMSNGVVIGYSSSGHGFGPISDESKYVEGKRVRLDNSAVTIVASGNNSDLAAAHNSEGTTIIYAYSGPVKPVEITRFSRAGGQAMELDFSADDSKFLEMTTSGRLTLWDISDLPNPYTWASVNVPSDLGAPYAFASVGKEGSLVTGYLGGEMKTWDTNIGRIIEDICSAGDRLSDEEWAEFFVDTEPVEVCS